jgi:23S rRNA (guanosine2251-2'-O)-methyltransferase
VSASERNGAKHNRIGGRRSARAPIPTGEGYVWGVHATLAALANPRRRIETLLVTRNATARLPANTPHELCEPDALDALLPPGAVHQGIAARIAPLPPLDLEDIAVPLDGRTVLVLDQITDPQNVGAIFRSAAALSARGIVMQDRKAPPLSGALLKAAAGAVEIVPYAEVVNIARAVEQLDELGYLTVALEGDATDPLAIAFADPRPLALVLGAEGKGVRALVNQRCERRARIPISPDMESLNVSASAAIALYEAARRAR